MTDSVKNLVILGSTGSIGRQTLQVVRNLPGRFRVIALAAGQNVELLSEQIAEFKPDYYYHLPKADAQFITHNAQLLSMEEMAALPNADIVVIATSGRAGLLATLATVKAGKKVAIANKEPLVMAGEIITREAKKSGAQILPIDSEHCAVWQCLRGEAAPIKRILLTASGGPFRDYSPEKLESVTPEQALHHPSWQMGKKITIDSATLMNKGLEIIEAHWLFGVDLDRIEVLVHHQSIIHSMVEFMDGSIKAQLACPDMRLPIQYALTYPERVPNQDMPQLDWTKIRELTFAQPDYQKFPCLGLAVRAAKAGGTAPAAICAADEAAVNLFMQGAIKFTDIARLVERVLDEHQNRMAPTLDDIIEIDRWAGEKVLELYRRR